MLDMWPTGHVAIDCPQPQENEWGGWHWATATPLKTKPTHRDGHRGHGEKERVLP